MIGVASSLITEFGSTGKILIKNTEPDDITGIGGSEVGYDVIYYREFFPTSELDPTNDRILAGDAMLYVVFDQKIDKAMAFEDDTQVRWNIVTSTPIETQGKDVIYELHIRK